MIRRSLASAAARREGEVLTAPPGACRILLVDDRPANLLALEAVLSPLGHDLVMVESGAEALAHLERAEFAVVLLDVQMPEMDGFETARRVKKLARAGGRTVPIIFVSAIDADRSRVASLYAHGAVDFLQKPFDPDVLRAKVAVFVELYLARRQLGAEREAARERLDALAELGVGLSQTRSRAQVTEVVIEHGMRLARADTCSLYLLDQSGEALELLGQRGVAPELVSQIQRITEGSSAAPTLAAMRAGTSMWTESAADYQASYPALHTLETRERRVSAFWSVPLIVEGRAIGLLGMGFYEARTFPEEERAFVGTFTKQCAQALQRALLLEREDETRRWLTTTLRSIGDAVLATDTTGRVTFMNPVAERMTGWTEGEAKGQPIDAVFPIFSEATRAPVESPVAKVLREGTVVGLANHTFLRARSGADIPIDDSGAPILDETGHLLGVVLAFRDVTHEKREAARREFLSSAGEALVSSLDYRQTLATVARLAVPELADWCAVELLEPGAARSQQLAVAHVDPSRVAYARELRERYPPDPHARTGVPEVIRSGRAELYPEIRAELLEAGAKDAEHLRIIRELRLDSAMVVPLRAHDRTLGAMSFIYAGSGRRYTDSDLAFAEDFARRAAMAIENARALKEAEEARATESVLRSRAELEIRRREEVEVERERRAKAEKFVAEASRLFSFSLDYEATVERVAQLAAPALADWCLVDLLTEDGDSFDRVGIGSHRPGSAPLIAALKRRYPLRGAASTGVERAILEGRSQVGRDLGDDVLRAVARDPEHLEGIRALAVRSFIVAPLIARGRPIGAFSLLSCDRNFDDRDLWLVEQLAASASASIDNARLFRAEQRAKHRVGRMQEITAALSRARSATEVAEAACTIGAKAVEAATGALWLLRDDGALALAGASGPPESLIGQFLLIPSGSKGVPALEVSRSGEPMWIETEADYRRTAPEIFEKAALAGHVMAYSAVPLTLDGRVEGVIVFAHPLPHRYDEDERAFYVTLAHHCSQALHRARLLDAERMSNERLRLLASAGETLARSLDIEETLRAVARLAVPAFCDWCIVDLVEGSEIRRVATVHSEPEKARAAEAAALRHPPRVGDAKGIGELIASGSVRFVPRLTPEELRRGARDAEHVAALEGAKLTSAIAIPLIAEGACVGALSFTTAESGRVYEEVDLRFAEDLGRRAGLAITNARLYQAARNAVLRAEDEAKRAEVERKRAEDANRIKDEFLATVSHELRTPLNAINGWAILLADKIDDRMSVAKGIEVIRRNAQAQTKIIEDILDVSRIVTGKLRIDPVPVDLIAIVRDAMEVVRPSADARQLTMVLEAADDAPCLLLADGSRLQQVFWNLLSNAIKFTDPGGRVTVRVEPIGASTRVTVSDTGRGIEADFLPYVFDRFRQGDGSTTRTFGGLGLGLSIVRHIVELHGGRVSVESAGPNLGASFTVVLPVRAVSPSGFPSERPAREDVTGKHAPSAGLHGARVLVVDDELDARELVETVLVDSGAVVVTAGSVREALEAFGKLRPEIVVSDIGMPDEDGYVLVREIRSRAAREGGGVPVVALTAYARAEDGVRAAAAGFTAHLAKPVSPGELVAVVARLLTAHRKLLVPS